MRLVFDDWFYGLKTLLEQKKVILFDYKKQAEKLLNDWLILYTKITARINNCHYTRLKSVASSD